MTPERLQQLREEALEGKRVGGDFMPDGVLELLNHIDALTEQLVQQSRDHTAEVLAWDALAVDTRAKAWDEGYRASDEQWTKIGFPQNPYRKDQ